MWSGKVSFLAIDFFGFGGGLLMLTKVNINQSFSIKGNSTRGMIGYMRRLEGTVLLIV